MNKKFPTIALFIIAVLAVSFKIYAVLVPPEGKKFFCVMTNPHTSKQSCDCKLDLKEKDTSVCVMKINGHKTSMKITTPKETWYE